ncbi:MAG: hypothetical protein ACLP5H_20490 [Desulfomonilaceae bacterium]
MVEFESVQTVKGPVITTKDTVAAYKLADMRRVFQYIEDDDLLALDWFILSGRAFHLPKGIEVYVLDSNVQQEGMRKIRIKGSITEIWASVNAISGP